MKVTRSTGSTPAPSSGRAAAPAGGFSLSQSGSSSASAPAVAASSVGGVADVSALMALQGVETATERRRRAIRRGGGLLDQLDALKIAMLAGETGEAALLGLTRAVAEARPDDQAADLDAVLDQIDLRAAVELAKAEAARTASA